MTQGDIHNANKRVQKNIKRVENCENLSEYNRELLLEFKDYLLSQDLSDTRIGRYLYTWYRLAPYIDYRLDEPEKKDIVALIGKINQNKIKDKEMAEETKKEYKKAVKKFYKDFIDSRQKDIDGEELTDFFTLTVKRKYTDPDRLPSPKIVKKLVKHADRTRDKALIMTLWSSAGRIGEVLGLKWKDVKFKDDIARVTFRNTKTGDDRTVPMLAGFLYLKELQDADEKSDDPEAFIFRSLTTDNQLSHNGACNIIERARKKTDIPSRIKTNPHAFRKGRATYLAGQGMNQAQLCEFGGWVQGSQEVAVYIRMAESDVEQGIRQIAGVEEGAEDDIEEDLNPVRCHECKTLNKFESENCKKCGAVLTASEMFEQTQIEEATDELMYSLATNEAGFNEQEIREKAQELVESKYS